MRQWKPGPIDGPKEIKSKRPVYVLLLRMSSTVVSSSASRRNRNRNRNARQQQHQRRSTRSTTAQRNAAMMTQIQFWCYPIPLVCQALGFVLGTAPAPHDQDLWGAIGNQATRSAQGVLLQLGVYTDVGCGMSP